MTWTFPMPPAVEAEDRAHAAWMVEGLRRFRRHLSEERANSPVIVRNMGQDSRAQEISWGHFHHMSECFLQLCGHRRFYFSDAHLDLEAGQALVVGPLTRHGELAQGSDSHVCANVVLSVQSGLLSLHWGRRSPQHTHPIMTAPQSLPAADAAWGAGCLERCARPEADPLSARIQLAAFVDWALAVASGAGQHHPGRRLRVNRALSMIHYHLGEPELSVSYLARRLDCSSDHLSRQFQADCGESLVGYIQRSRLEQARQLITSSQRPIADIAQLVGMPDAAYFSRCFRKAYGHPPSALRRGSQ